MHSLNSKVIGVSYSSLYYFNPKQSNRCFNVFSEKQEAVGSEFKLFIFTWEFAAKLFAQFAPKSALMGRTASAVGPGCSLWGVESQSPGYGHQVLDVFYHSSVLSEDHTFVLYSLEIHRCDSSELGHKDPWTSVLSDIQELVSVSKHQYIYSSFHFINII